MAVSLTRSVALSCRLWRDRAPLSLTRHACLISSSNWSESTRSPLTANLRFRCERTKKKKKKGKKKKFPKRQPQTFLSCAYRRHRNKRLSTHETFLKALSCLFFLFQDGFNLSRIIGWNLLSPHLVIRRCRQWRPSLVRNLLHVAPLSFFAPMLRYHGCWHFGFFSLVFFPKWLRLSCLGLEIVQNATTSKRRGKE